MPSKKTAHSLGEWQQLLQRLVLPVDPTIKSIVLQKLHTRTANANNIAAIIQRDPALSLQLMTEANKSLSMSDTETTSLSHTLSLLGFPQVESIIRRTPDYESGTFPHLHEYRQEIIISLHAAHQAQAWADHNPHWQQHDLFWPTLFQRAPIWALRYQAGEQMLELDYRRADRNGSNHSRDEKQLLGCTIQALAASLSRNWQLPQLSHHSWLKSQSGQARQWIKLSKVSPNQALVALEQDPALHQLCTQSAFAIALANKLADEAEWNWFSNHTLRLQRIAATALNLGHSDIIALSHQQATNSSFKLSMPNNLSPAKQLFSFYNKADYLKSQPQLRPILAKKKQPTDTAIAEETEKVIDKKASFIPEKQAKTNTSQTSASPSQVSSTLEYDEALERILQHPESFASVDELLQLALNTMCSELGFERAAASFFYRQDMELRNRLTCDAEDSPSLKNFRHSVKRGDIFSKLLVKPLSMRLQTTNYSKIWPLLPGNFKQACGADEFFMMSVFSNNSPVAIMYADHGNSNKSLNDQQYQQFKQLCRSLTLSLPSLT